MVDSKPVSKLQVCQREWGAMSRARHHIARKEVPNSGIYSPVIVEHIFC